MERTYDFIANSADGVFSVDRAQRIVLWNAAATRILGYGATEVLGRDCYEILRGRDDRGCAVCRRHCDALETAKHSELPPTLEFQVLTQSGSPIWINMSMIVVPSRHRDLSGLIHLFREVSRQHELLRAANALAGIVNESSIVTCVSGTPDAGGASPGMRLTVREHEVLRHLATGATTEAVSDRLCISRTTVRNHVTHILNKLGVHSRLEAVVFSIQHGLL